jgi:hypothetical protein
MPVLSALFLLCFCLPILCPAQQSRLLVTPPDQITVKKGQTAAELLNVKIIPGFHVNGDKPRDEYLIPLKLTWTAGPLQTKTITYPAPEELQVGADKLLVLTGNFQIKTEFKVPADAPSGATTVAGKLRYQACNTSMCFRPATADISLPVVIQ